jgi:pimeloyl-ACP methyl ester carboxylesterase
LVPEGRLAYEVLGEGSKVILCLPSLGDTRAQFRALVPCLVQAGYKVLVSDLRGQGQSDASFTRYDVDVLASDILAVLNDAGIARATIFASSISGASALVAARRFPERVEGLLLLGPVSRALPLGALLGAMLAPLFASRLGGWLWGRYYRSLFKRVRPDGHEAHLAAVRTMLREPSRRRALARYLLSDRVSSEAAIPGVAVPTTIVMGTKDPDFPNPSAEAEWLASALGRRGIVVLAEGVGHYPHLEVPNLVMQAFERHVSTIAEAA